MLSHERRRWVLVALILLAFAVRIYRLQYQSFWRDEVDAILFATGSWSKLLSMFTAAGENGPLYFVLLRPWLAVAGSTEFAARFFSLIWGVLAIPLTYRLGRRLLPTDVSVLGALLVAVSPYLIWYSQESKMYALLVCLTALSAWCLLGALQGRGRGLWIGYIVATSLSFYVHLLAVVLLPLHVLLFILGGRRAWSHWRGASIAAAWLTVPYVPFMRWEIRTFMSSFNTGHPFYSLDSMIGILFQGYSFGLRTPTTLEISLILFLLLLATFLYRQTIALWSHLEVRPQALWWLYVLAPVGVVFLISLRTPLFADRYVIAIAPAYYLILACGLSVLLRRSPVLFGLCLLGLLWIDGQGLAFQSHTEIKADFRTAAAYYAERAAPDDLLIFQMSYVRRNFDYYFRKPYHGADGLYTNQGMTPQQVDVQMQAMIKPYHTVWFLESEPAMWDQRGLVAAWLGAHGRVTGQQEFCLVTLSRYELNPEQTSDTLSVR
jgi:mannosyltransferase